MSVSICHYAMAVGECGTCGKPIEVKVKNKEGKDGVDVKGACGHYTWITNFEPLGGRAGD